MAEEAARCVKNKPLNIILFVAFIDLVSFGLIIPLLPTYAKRLDASGLTLGLLLSAFSLAQLIFNPLLGRWSDRVGRRRVLLLSIGGSVLSHALLGIADLRVSLTLLFVARLLDGVTGANIATAQAYIADVTTPENRARGMGLFGAAFGLGFVAGPGIGAGLVYVGHLVSGERYATAWPAFGASAIALAAFLCVWRWLPESRKPAGTSGSRYATLSLDLLRIVRGQSRLRELFTIMFTSIFAFVLLEVTFVYLCTDKLGIGMAAIGLIFAYIGILMVIVQGGLIGPLVRRFGEPTLIAIAPFITAVGFMLIAAIPWTQSAGVAWTLLLVGCVPIALGNGLTTPNVNALISRQAHKDRQGLTLGLAQGIGSLARTIAPPIGGLLYDYGASWPYWVGAAIYVCLASYAMRVRPAQMRALERGAGS